MEEYRGKEFIHLAECPECEGMQYDIQYIKSSEGSWTYYYLCNKCRRLYEFVCSDCGSDPFLRLLTSI